MRESGDDDQGPTGAGTLRWKQCVRRRLLGWYRGNARLLPWRQSRDPYRIWISEVMLQQTQVVTVTPYFERFVAAFPDIESLAEAEPREVLRLWEGLGYYRRAHQLHAAARCLVEQHGGQFPKDPNTLRSLPGIGRYTAGAILSIAFDLRQPILEANSQRLLTRMIGYRGDPRSARGQRYLWALAESLLPQRHAGIFNQALMELGSRLCKPRDPDCLACPLGSLCAARAANLQREIPRQTAKKRLEEIREVVVLVRRGEKVLLLQRPANERWAGLWDFPRFALSANCTLSVEDQIKTHVRQLTGIGVRPTGLVTTMRHGVTRFRITLLCYMACYEAGQLRTAKGRNMRWLKPAQLVAYPLPTTGRKLSRLLDGSTLPGSPPHGGRGRR